MRAHAFSKSELRKPLWADRIETGLHYKKLTRCSAVTVKGSRRCAALVVTLLLKGNGARPVAQLIAASNSAAPLLVKPAAVVSNMYNPTRRAGALRPTIDAPV